MASISHHISTLLYEHNCVIIPALGGFIANYQPAKIHPSSFIFNSPSKSIAFNVNLKQNDGLLSWHIASAEKISAVQAEHKISLFVQEVQQSLAESRAFKLPDIGRLIKDGEGNIQFIPDLANNHLPAAYGLYSYTAEPVEREKKDIRHIERIRIRPDEPEKNPYRFWLPAAAAVLVILFLVQLFVQTNRNGYNMAEVFGIRSFNQHTEHTIKAYDEMQAKPAFNYIHHYRTTEILPDSVLAPVQSANNSSVQYQEKNSAPAHITSYYLIAGVFGKAEYAETVIDKLSALHYNAQVLEKNDLFMVAIDIPQGEGLMKFRNSFAEDTKIDDAWVMKKNK